MAKRRFTVRDPEAFAAKQRRASEAAAAARTAKRVPLVASHAAPAFSDHVAGMRQRVRAAVGAMRTAVIFGDGDDGMDVVDAAIDALAIEADTNQTMYQAWRKRADEAEAALAASRTWQPIETAPKGHEVLLWNGLVRLDDWGDFAKYNGPKFTHWMPLPEPPVKP